MIPLTEPSNVACGPYASITPVMFDVGLQEPSDFSIHYNGTQGMVRAKIALPSTPGMTYTGPVPIMFDEATWKLDADRIRNLSSFKLDGGHMVGDGSVLGWRDRITTPSTPPSVVRYILVGGTAWTADTSAVLDDSSNNMRPGNEIVLPLEASVLRFFPQVRLANTATERNQLVVRQKFAGDVWVGTDQADKIARFEPLNPSAAVMTANHAILVYAASDTGAKQRIYASRRDADDQYEIGQPIEVDSDSELDDIEPWIGETCTTLYFRRGGVTYRAE